MVEGTGARAAAAGARRARVAPPARKERVEEIGRFSPGKFEAPVLRRVAAGERQAAWRRAAIRAQALGRVAEVLAWPSGRACPLARLREAWVAHRYGLASVAEFGAAVAGPARPATGRLVSRGLALYEAHAEHRPPGWPATGAAALCVLAVQRRAQRFAGDVARLLMLAKAMRATALEQDAARLARARARAERRQVVPSDPIAFRRSPRWETAEQRRQRVRDAVLLAGGDPAAWPNAELALHHVSALRAARRGEPRLVERDRFAELDGVGGRASRYRAELARGHWRMPRDCHLPDRTPDQEASTA